MKILLSHAWETKKVFSSAYVHNYMGLGFLDQLEQQYLSIIFFSSF